MADQIWPILLVLVFLFLTGSLGIVTGSIGDAVHILCPDPSNPFSGAV